MLSSRFIIENTEWVKERLKKREMNVDATLREIVDLDQKRRKTTNELNETQSKLNSLSREIGKYYKKGETAKAEEIKQQTAELKERIKAYNREVSDLEAALNDQLLQIPNIPHESVPQGSSDEDNIEVERGGTFPDLSGQQLPHWELAEKYDLIDFELGNKITGAGFPVYKEQAARLQRALITFFLDQAKEEGYKEVWPPLLVNEESGFGTGQLPDKEGQMYHIPSDNYYLLPTAEVPITNIFRDTILEEADFPLKYTAYTPCFRREAGSWGQEVRGLNRLHQFDKVEIVQIQHPDYSYQALNEMLQYAVRLLQQLNMPYRLIRLCGGDLGFASALTYDLEVYSAAQDKWLEVSSISNFESFQANRLKLRYKESEKKQNTLAHTLNGSALALPRLVAALLENNQDIDGIRLPEVLHPYTGFSVIQ